MLYSLRKNILLTKDRLDKRVNSSKFRVIVQKVFPTD